MAIMPSGFLLFLRGDAMEFQAVLDAVRAWPVDDRVRLVDLIQDELLSQDDDSKLPPELMEELDRRIAEVEASPKDGIPWEQVLAEARARHNR
jgi:putative addiction module component (TIGR02574 family)